MYKGWSYFSYVAIDLDITKRTHLSLLLGHDVLGESSVLIGFDPRKVYLGQTWHRVKRAKLYAYFGESSGKYWGIGEIRSDVDKECGRGG